MAEDVGGRSGRTVTLDAKTGTVLVRQAGGEPKVLAVLS
jgi:chemotaxis receptor (MCP) glutamine deamidase CheD